MSATIKIDATEVVKGSDEFEQKFGKLSMDQVRQAMGESVRLTLIEHFTDLEQDSVHHRTATRLFADSTGFYADAASKVQNPEIEGEAVAVAINKEGLAQRYFGGPIKPKNKKWITISAIAEAYGKRAGDFNNLHFVYFRPDLAALVENLSSLVKRDRNGVFKPVASTIGAVFFWLKKEVNQQPDPSVLPTDKQILDSAAAAGREEVQRIWDQAERNGGTAG